MSRQNTEKQILIMVVLLVMGVVSFGAYTWFDNGRRAEARDNLVIEHSERGAFLFARNCRVCHGNAGEGLIGPALNTPANTLAYRTSNQGPFDEIQNRFRFTIACGRNGTPMPPWAIDQGGSLDAFKIDTLVTLITTNGGNAWEAALEEAIHEDELAIQVLANTLFVAEQGGDTEQIESARADLEAAESRFASGRPIADPPVQVTANTCGQRSSSAIGGGSPSAHALPAHDARTLTAWLVSLSGDQG